MTHTALLVLSAGVLGVTAMLLLVSGSPRRGQRRGFAGPCPEPAVGGLIRGGPVQGGADQRETALPMPRARREGARRRALRMLGIDGGRGAGVTRDAAMLLRQLSALLQSGRGPGQVWADLAHQWAARGQGTSVVNPRRGAVEHLPMEHPLAQLCARAAAADRAGRGAADGLDRFTAELRERLNASGPLRRFIGPRALWTGALRLHRTGAPRRSALHHLPAWPWGSGSVSGSASPAGSRRDDRRLLRVASRLAGLLRLSEDTGAPLSRLAEELASTLDDDGEVAAAISSAVAGPRLTQVVLAALPVGGLLVGQLIGADVLGVLFGSPAGLFCLSAGGALMLAGVWWSRGMIRAVAGDG